ncbi:MAG: Eco57I restriction-modification methylase domain-containing protein, partial [Sphaerochaeta sp.]
MYQFAISEKYNRNSFVKFLQSFLPYDYVPDTEPIYEDTRFVDGDGGSVILGYSEDLDLIVYEFKHEFKTDPRVSLTKEVVSLMQKTQSYSNALVVFHNPAVPQWRLSLITTGIDYYNGKIVRKFSNPRRYSFVLGPGCKAHTPESMLFKKGVVKDPDDLKGRFAIDVVTEQFYKELFNWYDWAVTIAKYPEGSGSNVCLTDSNNKLNIIRLITRLIFVWFIKQKELIPDWIFSVDRIKEILNDFNPQSQSNGNYYNAIIQNLFFATLNRPIKERSFADVDPSTRHEQYGVNSYYRDDNKSSFFKIRKSEVIELFKGVPFLNGGMFECLDKLETRPSDGKNEQIYVDGFSREKGRRAFVPNVLFWGEEKDGHEGIVPLLSRYNFTVEENTSTEIDVALDPELLGKVFENLLGTYNPETSETARKDSGSFYTPREVVDFMVDESIKHYISKSVPSLNEPEINSLLSDEESVDLDDSTKRAIASALERIRILDPACGSGAFPMGCLQRIVSIEKRLGNSSNIYQVKLHVIKNCIYGIDIQPIAVQISKLRFFISLICDQKKNSSLDANYGIDPLPNLETKFVAANSLIGRTKTSVYDSSSLFENPEIEDTKKKLQGIRSLHFDAKTASAKREFRRQDKELREKLIKLLVQEQYSNPEDAKMLASWNPYDQNETSSFFDIEWMFGEIEGFDIVIGNPPYIQLEKDGGKLARLYENCGYKSFAKTGDLYCLFYEQGFNYLRQNGCLCYITSNKWMRAAYGEKLRAFFSSNTDPLMLIDLGGEKIFTGATVDTNILLFERGKNRGNTNCCITKNVFKAGDKKLSDYVQQNQIVSSFQTSDSWVILSPIEASIKRKIEAVGTPLKDWNIKIYRGVLTGFNEAFIISTEKRNEILANCADEDERKKTDELIRPILRGRDIKRYSYEWAGLYLIATFPSRHYDIDQYPALKKYLLTFGLQKLAQTGEKNIDGISNNNARKKTNNKWFETQDSISYWD